MQTKIVTKFPKLAIVQIGDRVDSNLFIKKKLAVCKYLNFQSKCYKLNSDIETGAIYYSILMMLF